MKLPKAFYACSHQRPNKRKKKSRPETKGECLCKVSNMNFLTTLKSKAHALAL